MDVDIGLRCLVDIQVEVADRQKYTSGVQRGPYSDRRGGLSAFSTGFEAEKLNRAKGVSIKKKGKSSED